MLRRWTLSLPLLLAGCATDAPKLSEFWAAPDSTARKLDNITAQSACELGKTVFNLSKYKVTSWLKDWGAQITLTLSATERAEVNPSASIVNPLSNGATRFADGTSVTTARSFNLGLGTDASSENTNKSTLSVFYTVPELVVIGGKAGPTCQPSRPATGYLFSESELGIAEWINAAVGVGTSGVARFPTAKRGPYGQNTISESFKFDIVSSGTVTPQWKLVRLTTDASTNLLTARRERIQQIDITFGPTMAGQFAPSAYAQLNAQLIAAALVQRGIAANGN